MSRLRCMVYGYTPESVNMDIQETIEDVIDWVLECGGQGIAVTSQEFESLLAEQGFMVVPIEDPTNLRFGEE